MSDSARAHDGAASREAAAAGLIIALNVLVNRVVPHRAQVPAGLVAAGLTVALARRIGVTWKEQGLDPRDAPLGAVAGIATASALTLITAAGLAWPSAGRFYQDQRIVGATARQMLYHVLVRIPFATAVPEELIFRGAFLGLLGQRRPALTAAAVNAALFGFWHVLPTLDRIHSNPGTRHAHGHIPRTTAVVAVHVATTTAMGFGLSLLRLRSRSIVAPVLAHITPNAVGFLGGWALARAPELRRRFTPRPDQADPAHPSQPAPMTGPDSGRPA